MATWYEGLGNEQGYLARGKGIAINATKATVTPYITVDDPGETADLWGIDPIQETRLASLLKGEPRISNVDLFAGSLKAGLWGIAAALVILGGFWAVLQVWVP